MKQENKAFTEIKAWLIDNKTIVKIVVGILAVSVLFFAWKAITKPKPKSYDDYLPMMEDARKFDQKAAEISGVYQGIENQLTPSQYAALNYKPYETSVSVQKESLDKIDEMNTLVMQRGGIINYNDLQRVKQSQAPENPVFEERLKEAEKYKY